MAWCDGAARARLTSSNPWILRFSDSTVFEPEIWFFALFFEV